MYLSLNAMLYIIFLQFSNNNNNNNKALYFLSLRGYHTIVSR